jgi:hypothetical protein
MPDPIQPTTDTTASAATVTTSSQPATPPAAPPPAASSAKFSAEQQEEVNRIVKTRIEEDRSRRTAAPAASATPPKADASVAPSMADIQKMISTATARESQLTTLMVTAGLDADQQRIARTLIESSNPSDVSIWWKETIEPLKLGKPPAPPAVQPAAPAASATSATEAPKPAAAPAAPSAHTLPTANGVVDLFNLTPAQLQSLGPQGVRDNLEKLWAIGNQMSGAPARPKPPSQR